MHSLPRLDAQPGEPLIPIEGSPPDLRIAPVGCPFAPRCAWRLERCWSEMPPLEPTDGSHEPVTTGAKPTHQIACWNPVEAGEAQAARPLRAGFEPAPPPAEAVA